MDWWEWEWSQVPGKKMKSIKKPKVYEALRDKGMSKEKAARITNSQAAKTGGRNSQAVSRRSQFVDSSQTEKAATANRKKRTPKSGRRQTY
jgi:hypothetical protein